MQRLRSKAQLLRKKSEEGEVIVPQRLATPNPDLKSLDRLVGTWQLSGEVQGQISFQWMEGGFFLLQRFDFKHSGRRITGIEIIGHQQRLGEEPSQEIKTRVYSFMDGLTLDYVYELHDDAVTIWFGDKGSSNFYQGNFSEDGNTFTGAWQWPGGGYKATGTRIKQ